MPSTSADIVVISDVHLGSRVCRSAELLATLKKLTFKTLILNGDIFDDLDFTRLSQDDWDLLSYFRLLANSTYHRELVWIAGNHDGAAPTLSHLIGVPVVSEYLFEWNGHRCLAIHGHQFDRFLHENIIISAIASSLYLFVQRLGGRQQRFARYIKQLSKAWLRLSTRVATGAARYGKGVRHADIVFCGHTHLELHLSIHGVDYWNSGCWTELPSAYLTLGDGKVEIHRVG